MLFWLCVHLICAIIFVGYVFVDAIFKLDDGFKKILLRKFGILYAISFGLLLLSGGMLVSLEHFSKTALGFLLLKLSLVGLMLVLSLISIIQLRLLKQKDGFLIKYAHFIALALCVGIVISAKLIWLN